LSEGAVIAGRYRLEHLLGKGGMGFVWAATHLVTRRWVALKVLLGPLVARPEMRRRFLREARAAAAVEHPNVVEIYDVFEIDPETPVMVMALLRGETFAERLDRAGSLPLDAALRILLPVVSAVGSAHACGVVHRDLKPENVFLAREAGREVVKVLDFGIAKLEGDEGFDPGNITSPGTMLGTPCYMAPEQAFGERDADHRADIWSLGVLLYEALSGERPVEGENLGQVLKRILSVGIPPIAERVPSLPAPIASIIMRMLAYDRKNRPDDLREVYEVLSAFTSIEAPAFEAPAARVRSDSSEREALGRSRTAHTLVSTPHGVTPSREPVVDPDAPTEQFSQPGTPAAHSVSVANQRVPQRALLASTIGVVGVGVLFWQLAAGEPSAPVLGVSSAQPARVVVPNAVADALPGAAPALPTAIKDGDTPEVLPAPSEAVGTSRAPLRRPAARLAIPRLAAPRHARAAEKSNRPPATLGSSSAAPAAATPASAPAAASTASPVPSAAGLHEEPPF
jgi:serine/threonine protein kinase